MNTNMSMNMNNVKNRGYRGGGGEEEEVKKKEGMKAGHNRTPTRGRRSEREISRIGRRSANPA